MFRYKPQINPTDEPAKLPGTRRRQFSDILRGDFSLIVNLSLFCFLFSLWLLAVRGVEYALLTGMREVTAATVFPLVFWGSLLSLPGWGLRYVGRCAAFGVMKRRAHNEGCLVSETFWKCVREEFGKSFFVGLLVGVSAALAEIGVYSLLLFTTDPFARGLGIGVSALQFALMFCTAEYFSAQLHLYEMPLYGYLKNGFSFTVMFFIPSLIHFTLCCVLPLALCVLIPGAAIPVVGAAALAGDGITICAATLFSFSAFDRIINKTYYPDLVRRGLHRQSDDTDREENSNG